MNEDKTHDGAEPSPEDITRRLRGWTHAVNAAPASDLMDEAAAEIENLREAIRRLADQDATLSVCRGNVTVDLDGTLTDAEREAVADAIRRLWGFDCAVTLRALLERTK